MSHAGGTLKKALAVVAMLDQEKPHTSITDWIEVLTSDRYEELSLDGIPELVESVNIQGHSGTGEASRALRKKLKYGNVHRQLRALVILRALTDNAGKGFKLNWADERLVARLREMAADNLLDPKVRKRLLLVFHAWSIQYKDEPRMSTIANMYRTATGGPASRRSSTVPAGGQSVASRTAPAAPVSRAAFDDDLFSHDWAPSQRGADTYADLAAARADADSRKAERERRIALEQREAELERREREQRRKTEMANVEARRQKEAAEEAERRRQAKLAGKNVTPQPKRPKFDFEREKPKIMVAVANAIQCANNLVNSCRHVNREHESLTESPKVQDNLDKAKAARRAIIRYIQLVQNEDYVGTLLDANEKVVESIQLYDRLSKPATHDSDSDGEHMSEDAKQIEAINKRLRDQTLSADRTGEIQQLQDAQKRESARKQRSQIKRQASTTGASGNTHPDLQDLNFGSIPSGGKQNLPPPMRPDSAQDDYGAGLSDYSDGYDSSDEEWQRARSRRQSMAGQRAPPPQQQRQQQNREWASLDDDASSIHRGGLLDPNDPFGDPFADDNDTPLQENKRMQCNSGSTFDFSKAYKQGERFRSAE